MLSFMFSFMSCASFSICFALLTAAGLELVFCSSSSFKAMANESSFLLSSAMSFSRFLL